MQRLVSELRGMVSSAAASRFYTQVLDSMLLGRVGVGVRESAAGVAETFHLDPERLRVACVGDALALARITDGAST